MSDIYSQIITICWFNSILISLLYSQNSRDLLLSNENLISKRRDNIFEILHQILTR
jgi:hypothetical protein